MTREEYVELHRILAILKYEETKLLITGNLIKKSKNEIKNNLIAIERIEKIIFINGDSNE